MNKITDELKRKTDYNDKQIEKIDIILNDHFIIGKNNKKKIINDFVSKLDIDMKEADKLYNTCMSIIMNGIKEKIKHPFRKNK